MKIRTGFVSNSSSSSFIVKPDIQINKEYIINPYGKIQNQKIDTKQIMQRINEDILVFDKLSLTKQNDNLFNVTYNNLMDKIVWKSISILDKFTKDELELIDSFGCDYFDKNYNREQLRIFCNKKATEGTEGYMKNKCKVLTYDDNLSEFDSFMRHTVMSYIANNTNYVELEYNNQ